MTHSLRLRLLLWVLALLVPATVGGGLLLARVFADRVLRDVDVRLAEEADTAILMLQRVGPGAASDRVLKGIVEEVDLGPGKRIIVRRGGTVIAEIPSGSAAALEADGPAYRSTTHTAGPPDDALAVTVAIPAPSPQAARRLRLLLIGGIPVLIVMIAGGLWLVMGHALRPLEDAAERIEAIGADDLRTRIPLSNPDDEVGRMVAALNRMLDRVATAVAELQRFTADAAHELRTPLAVLRAGLEVTLARDRPAEEYRAALVEALDATERLSQLAEDLLTLTRMEALPPHRHTAPLRLAEMLHELADAWSARAVQGDVEIAVAGDPALQVEGNAADLYRLLTNLIENALRHTPAGGRVTLHAAAENGRAEVRVTDTGCGIPSDELPRVFDRFYRARGETGSGNGLGLSIARAIARAHGGELTLANRPEGGCQASLSLPTTLS